MLGAIVGDIVGSVYEWHNIKTKDFPLFRDDCFFTDDTVMSLAICDSLMNCSEDRSDLGLQAVSSMQTLGRRFSECAYGARFYEWIFANDPKPYNSWGNGAAMRVSACGWAGDTIEEVKATEDAANITFTITNNTSINLNNVTINPRTAKDDFGEEYSYVKNKVGLSPNDLVNDYVIFNLTSGESKKITYSVSGLQNASNARYVTGELGININNYLPSDNIIRLIDIPLTK